MKLWIVRHAKSDWASAAATDFERPLNRRGERDAPRMVEWLQRQNHPATWIWTSDALRARTTAGFVEQGFAAARPRVIEEHRLYGASPEELLSVLQETPADQHSVAVVAHNPGLTQLANLLTGTAVTDNLPTFGVVRLEVPEPWSTLAFGRAALDLFISPKRLPG